jgi:uncharacterized protein (DUF2126 family)
MDPQGRRTCPRMSIPSNSKLKDPRGARSRIARVFERGLTTRAAMCCRCRRGTHVPRGRAGSAKSGARAAASLFLVPGDSAGRLPPAARLAAVCAAVAVSLHPHPVDPSTVERGPAGICRTAPCRSRWTARCRGLVPGRPAGIAGRAGRSPISVGTVRTAISVEPRDGRLCVFMPPTEGVEEYLELIASRRARGERARTTRAYRGLCPAAG